MKSKVSGLHDTMVGAEKMDNLETLTADNSGQKLSKAKVWLSRLKRRLLKHVWLWRITIVISISLVIGLIFTFLLKPLKNTQIYYYASLAKVFLTTPDSEIKSSDSRTNILVLGKGGSGHEAPDLTDTMMVASFSHTGNDIVLVSFPRDIWVTSLEAKLNSVYYWGNQKKPGGGIILAKSVVEEISGKNIDYALVIDFSGFKKIIDVLGGIEVDVMDSFIDSKYPIAGKENDSCDDEKNIPALRKEYRCRYETISFEKGIEHVDGERALKFVRSRNAEGTEGTDLARAARQQRVIEAIKEKVLSREILLHPTKIIALKDAVLSSVETDITPEAGAILARKIVNSKMVTRSSVLSDNLLEVAPKSPTYQNLYVFIPKEVDPENPSFRSWKKVNEWFQCILEARDDCS